MTRIDVYGYTGCGYSQRARDLCEKLHRDPRFIVTCSLFQNRYDPTLVRMAAKYDYQRVPIVVVDGVALRNGYEELVSSLSR